MVLNLYEIVFRIGIIYTLICIGSVLRHLSKDPDNSPYINLLTKFILNLFFPFLVISSFLNVSGNSFFIIFLSISFGLVVSFTGFFSVYLYSKIKSIPKQTLGSMFLAVSFPNSVFLPFPLILMLIGPQGLISATLFAVTIIFLQNSIGTYVAISFGSTSETKLNIKFSSILKKVFLFPPMLSMIIGFLVKVIFQPVSFSDFFSFLPFSSNQINFTIDSISWISLILALLLVGLTFNLSFKSLKNKFLPMTSTLRLIVSPFIGIAFILIIYIVLFVNESINSEFIIPLIIQAFSGPAIINIAFAKEFSLDVESESVYITIITLLSLLILPFLVIILFAIL